MLYYSTLCTYSKRSTGQSRYRKGDPLGKQAGDRGNKREGPKRGRREDAATNDARERVSGLLDPDAAVVIADPLRQRILAIAVQRSVAPSEFAKEVGIPVPAAAYHFKVLCRHGYLELVEEIPVRGSTKHMYRATKAAILGDLDWGALPDALRPGIAGTILQDFNGRVSQAMDKGTLYRREGWCLYWAPMDLDAKGWEDMTAAVRSIIERSETIPVEVIQRRANGESDGPLFSGTFGIASFESPAQEDVKGAEVAQTQDKTQANGESRNGKKGRCDDTPEIPS